MARRCAPATCWWSSMTCAATPSCRCSRISCAPSACATRASAPKPRWRASSPSTGSSPSDPRVAEHLARERAQFAARPPHARRAARRAAIADARGARAVGRRSRPDRLDRGVRPPCGGRARAQRETGRGRLRAARAAAAAAARRRRLSQPARRNARRAGAGAPARRRAAGAHGRRAQSLPARPPPKNSSRPHRRLRELEERLRPSQGPGGSASPSVRRSTAWSWACASPRRAKCWPRARRSLDVVPSNEMLVVEARIRPQDISHVYADAQAKVRLAAFDARTTPLLPGRVTFVSPDRMSDARDRRVLVRGHGRSRRGRAAHITPTSSSRPACPRSCSSRLPIARCFEYL